MAYQTCNFASRASKVLSWNAQHTSDVYSVCPCFNNEGIILQRVGLRWFVWKIQYFIQPCLLLFGVWQHIPRDIRWGGLLSLDALLFSFTLRTVLSRTALYWWANLLCPYCQAMLFLLKYAFLWVKHFHDLSPNQRFCLWLCPYNPKSTRSWTKAMSNDIEPLRVLVKGRKERGGRVAHSLLDHISKTCNLPQKRFITRLERKQFCCVKEGSRKYRSSLDLFEHAPGLTGDHVVLVRCIILRAAYGGMGGDIQLLKGISLGICHSCLDKEEVSGSYTSMILSMHNVWDQAATWNFKSSQ